MRNLLGIKGRILVAVAAGGLCLSAAFAAQTGSSTAKKPAAKSAKTSSGSASSSTSHKKSTKGGKSSHGKVSSKRVKGQAAPTPERINEIQQALTAKGAYSETPSGKWDDSTVDAMKKFQAAHGLTPSGKMDALTLQKLGLGSETAGMGKPTPPPNAAANRLLSSKAKQDEAKNETQQPE